MARGTLTTALFVGILCGVAGPAAAAAHGAREGAARPIGTIDPREARALLPVRSLGHYGDRFLEPPGSWSRPVAGGEISAPYGVPGDWAAGHHTGIDLAVPVGTSVRSVGSGTIVFAGDLEKYGKTVIVRMADGKYVLFAHLSRIVVDEGESVRAGTQLGESGNTGRTTGPHLHFEVRTGRDYGSDVNPVSYLNERGVYVG